jgi:SNF2 family DNA or RNA helicase
VAVRLICPNTIEEKIMQLQEVKRTLSDDVVRTDASIYKSIIKLDLLGLVGGIQQPGL